MDGSVLVFLLPARTSYVASDRPIGSVCNGYYLYLNGAAVDHVEINRSLYTEAAQ